MVKRIARHFLRTCVVAAAILVIIYAVLVVVAREMLPVINRYQPEINAYLSEKTGLDFNIDRLSGLWRGLTPSIELEDVAISALSGDDEALHIDKISAELNTARSVTNLNPVWRELSVGTARVSLLENEEGRWTLGGHPLGGGGGNLDTLKEMLFYSRLLHIDTLDVSIQFYSGAQSRVRARDIEITNGEGFHRVIANLYLDSQDQESARFVFEGLGDPADLDEFTGQGYLSLQRLNLEGSISALLARLFPRQVELVGDVQTDFGLNFWFDWLKGGLVKGRGTMAADEIPLRWLADTSAIQDFSANFTAWFTPGEDWGVQVNGLNGEWHGAAIEPLDFRLRQGVGRHWGNLELATSYLNLTVVKDLVEGARLVRGQGLEVIKSLNPAGHLHRVFLEMNFSKKAPSFTFRSNLRDVAIESWRGSPAAKGVSGYISASAEGGYLVLDSAAGTQQFAMHYHQAFADYMPYGDTLGKVAWQIDLDDRRVLVTSNRIRIVGEEGKATAFLHLDLPFDRGRDPQMHLMVGLKDSHSEYLGRYLPEKAIPQNLYQWLTRAVGDAVIDEAGFIWRGSLIKSNSIGRSIQVYSKIRQGNLDYQEGWPAVTELSAKLVVDNARVNAWAEEARLGEARLQRLGVSVRNPTSETPMLFVGADISSPLSYGLQVLADSPLQLDRLEALRAGGDADIQLDLRIPLSDDRSLEDYRVSANLNQGNLQIPGSELRVSQIEGSLHYSLSDGLNGRNLEARFLENRVRGDLRTHAGRLEMDLASVFDSHGLDSYMSSYTDLVAGKTPVTGRLTVPLAEDSEPAELNLSSTLVGISLNLPDTLGKSSEEQTRFSADISFGRDHSIVDGSLENRVAFALEFSESDLARGQVRLFSESASLPQQPGLLISGSVEEFVWSDWESLLTGNAKGEMGQDGETGRLAPRLDLDFGQVKIGDFALGPTMLKGERQTQGWHFVVASDRAKGEILVPMEEGMVPKIELDYLKLPNLKELVDFEHKGEHQEIEKGLAPTDVPEINFQVDQLIIGDAPWGNLAFQSRHKNSGLTFERLEGNIRGVQISPQSSETDDAAPAELRWSRKGGRHSSVFSGALILEDVETVLNEWGAPAPLSSESAVLFAEMSWQGTPWDIGLLKLKGYLGLEFRNGEFYKATNAGANTFFKLVSLVNFDTWLRRLRFDFSDLFSSGVSFDRVEGGLLFDEGKLTFDAPLVASMPSGKIRLMGGADLAAETLDARLVATMPVGTNLPWVAGLLGGLPAAAGVYLTSKIFEKQVDQLSSLSYRIEGSFDDPDVEVERIFTDPTKGE